MLRFTLRESARLLFGLIGALLLASLVSALTNPAAWHGIVPLVMAAATRFVGFLTLDFGTSAVSARPVTAELAATLPLTLAFAGAGIVIALILGVPVGILFGAGPIRRAAAPLIQVVAAAPIFCASLALAYAASRFHWPLAMPDGGGVTLSELTAGAQTTTEALEVALLPALTIGLAGAAAVQLALRRAASMTSRAPYRDGLRRLGLSAFEIDRTYVVPEVLAGLAASFGELVLALFAASAVAEWIFATPGAALLFIKSVALNDWTLAGATLFCFAGIFFVADFAGQLAAHAIANPGRTP